MKKVVYQLIEKIEPSIRGNILVNDFGAAGVKLRFLVSTFNVYKVGPINLASLIPINKEEKIYLRPLKKSWSTKRERLSKNHWGKSTHPLLGPYFWWEVEFNYGSKLPCKYPIMSGIEPIADHALIKSFNVCVKDKTEKFHLYINNQK